MDSDNDSNEDADINVVASASTIGGTISRGEAIARAQRWVDLDVMYSRDQNRAFGDGDGHTYRPDCSGMVSMAWHLPKKSDGWDFNTGDFGAYAGKTYIGYDDLRAGDAILGVGHMVLFDRWTDSSHTSMWIYQESATGTPANHVTRARSGYVADGFRPIRYNMMIDGGGDPDPTLDGPAAILAGDLHTFRRGTNGHLTQTWWSVNHWVTGDLGGNIVGTPVPVLYGGSLNVFARDAGTGSVRQWYWANSQWSIGDAGGGFAGDLTAIVAGPDLHLFARDANGHLIQKWWNGSGWITGDLGGNIVGTPVPVLYGGSLNVFARDAATGSVRQWYWANSQWNIGDAGGGFAGDLTAIVAGPDLHLFARGANGHLIQKWWNGSGWITVDLG